MRDFLHMIFKSYEVPADSFWHAEAFTSIWHYFYIVVIAGAIIGGAIALNRSSDKTKKRVLDILPIVVIGLYIFDLFVRPIAGLEFANDKSFQQAINGYLDKLPFHICTSMGIVCVFAQHCKKLEKFKGSFAILSIVGPLMYMVAPLAVFGDNHVFCYNTIQTILFHGVLMAWGILSITTGQVKVSIKNWYKTLAIQGVLFLWGVFGNVVFSNMSSVATWNESGSYNWFFIKDGAGVIPNVVSGPYSELIYAIYAPFGVFAAIYAVAIGVCGCAHLGYFIAGKCKKNKASVEEKVEENALV